VTSEEAKEMRKKLAQVAELCARKIEALESMDFATERSEVRAAVAEIFRSWGDAVREAGDLVPDDNRDVWIALEIAGEVDRTTRIFRHLISRELSLLPPVLPSCSAMWSERRRDVARRQRQSELVASYGTIMIGESGRGQHQKRRLKKKNSRAGATWVNGVGRSMRFNLRDIRRSLSFSGACAS